jgi:hypothetical protein
VTETIEMSTGNSANKLSRVTVEPETANYAMGHSPTEIRRLGIAESANLACRLRRLRSFHNVDTKQRFA